MNMNWASKFTYIKPNQFMVIPFGYNSIFVHCNIPIIPNIGNRKSKIFFFKCE